MAKSFLTLLLFSLILSSCNHDDKKFVIEGEISNLISPYIIASYRISDSTNVDTIFVDEYGKFSYTQKLDTSTMFILYFNDFSFSTLVFTENGVDKFKLKGDAFFSDLIEVKGGKINENLSAFKRENETLLKQRSLLISKIDYESDSPINSVSVLSEKEKTAIVNSLNHELAQKVEDYILANPDKISSVILINDFFKNNENPETLNRILNYLSGDALRYSLTIKLRSLNQKLMLSAEGSQMPYFKIEDIKEKIIESSDFENKYLLISFLSSNDEESKDNITNLKKEYSSLKKHDIDFLSVFIDSDTLPITYQKKDSIPWKIVVEDRGWGSDIAEAYNVHYLPFNILIDRNGKILTRDIPANDIKNLIDTTFYKSKK